MPDSTSWRNLRARIGVVQPDFAARGTWGHRIADDHIDEFTFACARRGDRWAIEKPADTIRAVGDRHRDLVATGGGLKRRPPGRALRDEPASFLLSPGAKGLTAAVLDQFTLLSGPEPGLVANRNCHFVKLLFPEDGKFPVELFVDDDTGLLLRVELHGRETTSVFRVDDLLLAPSAAPNLTRALRILDDVPDIDLTPRKHDTKTRASAAVLERIFGPETRISVLMADPAGNAITFRIDNIGGGLALLHRGPAGVPPHYEPILGTTHGWTDGKWDYTLDFEQNLNVSKQYLHSLAHKLMEAPDY